MKKFFKKMRYRIACAIAPKGVWVMPEDEVEEAFFHEIAKHKVAGVKRGVRMGMEIIHEYMKHLNGKPAEDWCKEIYSYTEWKMNNLTFEVEIKESDDDMEVCVSVPKDFDDREENDTTSKK